MKCSFNLWPLAVVAGLSFLVSGCGQAVDGERANATAEAPRVAKGNLKFIEGYQPGLTAAQTSDQPMLLFFTAAWCHFCHQMAGEAFTHPEVVGLSNQFVCVLVDADREPEVCQQFGVRGYPTIQFVSPQGSALSRLTGKRPGPQLVMEMQAVLRSVARRNAPDDQPLRR